MFRPRTLELMKKSIEKEIADKKQFDDKDEEGELFAPDNEDYDPSSSKDKKQFDDKDEEGELFAPDNEDYDPSSSKDKKQFNDTDEEGEEEELFAPDSGSEYAPSSSTVSLCKTSRDGTKVSQRHSGPPLKDSKRHFVPFSLTTFCPTFLRWTNMSAACTTFLVQSILLHFPTICTNDILSHIPELDQYVGSMHDILVQFTYIPSLSDNVYQRHSVPRFIRNIDLGKISTVELLVN
ncbi:hypothetical protein LSTR_LSTR008222 [Laodelphax striatellus]|uniref:Uncharacterized protein n=1 Tax=Laodelphax striatellus TaxID=195883 RepID=A0A482WK10_LAOST|nr:hypothetical protein LSTR_LSTR008222 [Laodelphax striatellus]